jgi:hypothetical protein
MTEKFEMILTHKINKKFPDCTCDTCYEEHNYKQQIKLKENSQKLKSDFKYRPKIKKDKSCIIS